MNLDSTNPEGVKRMRNDANSRGPDETLEQSARASASVSESGYFFHSLEY